MDYYANTLHGMQFLLQQCGKDRYANIIGQLLADYTKNNAVDGLAFAFSPGGSMSGLSFDAADFHSEQQLMWIRQLFEALKAMAVQLALFILHRHTVDIDFIRKHFGRFTEVIHASYCSDCHKHYVTSADIDEYISPEIISQKIFDGLEHGNLNENIAAIVEMTAPEIERRRRSVRRRLSNSQVAIVDHSASSVCLLCGSNHIKSCRLLKSLKKNIFIPLNQ